MTDYMHPGYRKPYPIQTVLRDLASQEGCDGEPYDAMVFAAARIDALEAKVARLEGALRGLLSAVDAWAETPPRSDAEMEASFPVYAAAETARAALTEGNDND